MQTQMRSQSGYSLVATIMVIFDKRNHSDLGLHSFSRPFWQLNSVQNFRNSVSFVTFFSMYQNSVL